MHLRPRGNPGKGWHIKGFRPTAISSNIGGKVTVFGTIGVDPTWVRWRLTSLATGATRRTCWTS